MTQIARAQSIQVLREESRQIMRTRLCGVCHIPPGNSKALKIFDLNKENWASTMSESQLLQIRWRIKVKGAEVLEMHGDPKKHEFTAIEMDLLNAYVDAEIKERNPVSDLFSK